MFTSLTWELFFTSIIAIACCYYAITSLTLYRMEIFHWFNGYRQITSTKESETSIDEVHLNALIGGISKDESSGFARTSSIDAGEVNISPTKDKPEILDSPLVINGSDLMIRSFGDAIQEIKLLAVLIIECSADKAESQMLFHALLIKYSHLLQTPYQDAISLYICEVARNQFSFSLSLPEVKNWWQFDTVAPN